MAPRCGSPCRTRASVSPRKSRTASSRSSIAWGGARRRADGAAAWAWPWSSTSRPPMGEGSRWRVAPARAARSRCVCRYRGAASVPRILIVDDEPEMIRGLVDNLRFEGYQTITAGDGERGLALALSEAPDLIVLDLMMPGLSGWDVCRTLRQKGLDIPVIMLTARGEEVDQIRGLEMGADD